MKLKSSKPAHFFANCAHKNCGRRIFCGQTNRVAQPTSPTVETDAAYWSLIAKDALDIHPSKFCSFSCFSGYQKEVAVLRAVEASISWDEDGVRCRKEGRGRVAEALRACTRRNERAGRIIRDAQSARMSSLDKRPYFAMLKQRLNVDLGLIYAASLLAESTSLSAGKVLAATHPNWRRRHWTVAAAAKKVLTTYEKFHTRGNIVSNLWIDEPFLRHLKSKPVF
jgi:hypothetical protein